MKISFNERYLKNQIIEDLQEKMVFLAGPRQVGKTTLAKSLVSAQNLGSEQYLYLNYDIPKDRQIFLRQEFNTSPLWIFDEIHKYRKWKNHLKGIYDQFHLGHQILVTGSARLELFRKAGDSLQGRYHFLRMYPLSAKELKLETQSDLLNLFELSGFPEPFFSAKKEKANRWSKAYQSRIIDEEITAVERIHDLGAMELLAYRLPDCVGSPLSINSLKEDLGYNFNTIKRWIILLEKFYAIFRLPPYGASVLKSVKKEQKHYHFDWNCIEVEGPRFECMIAVHLQKYVHYQEDSFGKKMALSFFRDIEGREVDFIITEKGQPLLAIECKLSDDNISKSLIYLKNKFPNLDCWQIHLKGKKDYLSKENIRVAPAIELLKNLI